MHLTLGYAHLGRAGVTLCPEQIKRELAGTIANLLAIELKVLKRYRTNSVLIRRFARDVTHMTSTFITQKSYD